MSIDLGAARPYDPRCFQVLVIGCRQNIAQPKAIHAGALMPRAYLNERATRRSGWKPRSQGLGKRFGERVETPSYEEGARG